MTRHRVKVVAFVVVMALAGCARAGSPSGSASSPPTGITSGVRGSAVVDIGCPVLQDASACPRVPLRARISAVLSGAAQPAAVVQTKADGTFEIGLPPGVYELRGDNLSGAPVPSAMPVAVTVRAGEFVQVTVVFDSGVRGPSQG